MWSRYMSGWSFILGGKYRGQLNNKKSGLTPSSIRSTNSCRLHVETRTCKTVNDTR